MPKRCHSAHDKNEQRTRKIEDKVIHIARARSGVHLQDLHRRDRQHQRGRVEENAPLPAEQRRQEHAHRRERDQVARKVQHHQPQRDISVAVGRKVVLHRTQRLKIDHVERGMAETAPEGIVKEQHVEQHPYVIREQEQHIQPPPGRPGVLGHAAEQREAQQHHECRRKQEFLLGPDHARRIEFIVDVEAQQRRRQHRRRAAKQIFQKEILLCR